jgi:RHH-type proline utilization regulon transcriptional repressor/proline dehydrogenase/delta 1-pyrroline-5-carboxylate dehydrogenase
MRQRKGELSAWMVLEVAKNFREADADVAEAIDFCDYYAEQMELLATPQSMSDTPGESNHYQYQARGVTLAIAPWNFPLAILCGMTVGPLVAGNPVIMKPAEQSSAIARKLFDLLIEAGVPSDVLHFVPGLGEEVGAALVLNPLVHVINFTGSRAVGLKIMEDAARVQPGQRHIKKVIAELGGKNAVIIDDDADLDEAVVGCLHSAFGFQGQKCSALSRIIIVDSAYEKFRQRFLEALASFKIGPADDVAYRVGPVIDSDAKTRLEGVAARNKAFQIAEVPLNPELKQLGHYVAPRVFESQDFRSELGQTEFFGPFVTLFRVQNFDQALEAFNDTEYALTGGLYSRSPEHIERMRAQAQVGNLYVNRPITGALVCRQPFGGFRMSGCGGKAGGPDYLLNFLEPRSITENTMRRGFAPELK